MNIENIIKVFREITDYDTLHYSIAEDVEDTRLDKSNTPRVLDMPGMGFYYILDTKHYTLTELANLATAYREKMAKLETINDYDQWTSWDILEYLTGSDMLTAPPGATIVTHDIINSYAYPRISDYAQDNTVHIVA